MQLHGCHRVTVNRFTSSPSSSKTSAHKIYLETHPTILLYALILVHHTYMRMKHYHSSVICHSALMQTHTHTHTHLCFIKVLCFATGPAIKPERAPPSSHDNSPPPPPGGPTHQFPIIVPLFENAVFHYIYICLTFPVALLFSLLYDSI